MTEHRREYLRKYRRQYRLDNRVNKERVRENTRKYNLKYPEWKKNYRIKNKKKIAEYNKNYQLKNRERLSKLVKEWRLKNKTFVKKYDNEYRKKRSLSDIQFKLTCRLRSRLGNALKRNYKIGSAIKDLGCSINEFKFYLEGQFISGMSWKNYGKWHIDHKIPLAYFDLTNREQLLKAVHYTNLQPLWAKENMSKRNRV